MTADELAKLHHERLETYNRTVCTGPVVEDRIKPGNPREWALCKKNEHDVWCQTMRDSVLHNIGPRDMALAIIRCAKP